MAYATANGTATRGQRLRGASRHAHLRRRRDLARSSTSRSSGDTAVEANETLTLTLSSPNGATIADGTATGTIVNDDTAPLPTLCDRRCDGSPKATRRAGPWRLHGDPVGCRDGAGHRALATADGTADRGQRLCRGQPARSPSPPARPQKTITCTAIGDTTVEANETLHRHAVVAPRAPPSPTARRSGTIVNDDAAPPPPLPTLSISDASVVEGNPGRQRCRRAGWLSTSGNQIVDANGHPVQIAGVNWFGFETDQLRAARPVDAQLQGHDGPDEGARLQHHPPAVLQPDCFDAGSTPNGIDFSKNPDLQGLTACRSWTRSSTTPARSACGSSSTIIAPTPATAPTANGLWYTPSIPESRWIADWKMLADALRRQPDGDRRRPAQRAARPGTWGDGGRQRLAAGRRAGRQRHPARSIPTG